MNIKEMIMVKSKCHKLFTISMRKKALSSCDDKIFRINVNEVYPYGYMPSRDQNQISV